MFMAQKPKSTNAQMSEDAVFEYAVRALGRSMRTETEVRRLVRTRVGFGTRGAAMIEAIIARLKQYGYLNDAAYAEAYVRLRQENEKLGQRRVRQVLGQKGISAKIVDEAVEARYGKTDEETLAREHLERKRIPKPTNQKETMRVVRRLVAAGFTMSVIYKILRQWDVPDEELAGLEDMGNPDESAGEE
jgi:regulatory protein